MDKQEIVKKLKENHQNFIHLIESLNKEDFEKVVEGKWTPGQQAEHIFKSVNPVVLALKLPMFMLKLFFSTNNRNSKSFDELVMKYNQKLLLGGKATNRFIPKKITYDQKEIIIGKLKNTIEKLCTLTLKLDEKQLDTYLLPHPLLGKLTLREMLFFTIYHVTHHQKSVMNILNTKLSL